MPKRPDELGRLACVRLGLCLAPVESTLWSVTARWLRWLEPGGRVLQLPSEFVQEEAERANAEAERANAEAERANAEAERANSEAARANRLEAELAELRRGQRE